MDILNPLHYVAANNPQAVNNVLRKYGLSVGSEDEIFDAVDILTQEYGEKAVNEVMQHHPDRDALRYSKSVGSLNTPFLELSDEAKADALINGGRTPANANGNGNGMQDRWILIALLLLAIFAVGTWVGKQTK